MAQLEKFPQHHSEQLNKTANDIEKSRHDDMELLQSEGPGVPFIVERSDGSFSYMWPAGFHAEETLGRHKTGVDEDEAGTQILIGGTPEWNEGMGKMVLPRKPVPVSRLSLQAQSRLMEKAGITSEELMEITPDNPEALESAIEDLRTHKRIRAGKKLSRAVFNRIESFQHK